MNKVHRVTLTVDSVNRLRLAIWLATVAVFAVGGLLGAYAGRPTMNSVNEWMDKQPLSAQHDFLEARLKFLPGVRRQLAEDWCATNADTQDVCRRAFNATSAVRRYAADKKGELK